MAAVPHAFVLEYQWAHIAPSVDRNQEIRVVEVALMQVGVIINNYEHLSQPGVVLVNLADLYKVAEATAQLDNAPIIMDYLSTVFDQQADKIVTTGGREACKCLCHARCVKQRRVEHRGKDCDATTRLHQHVCHQIMRLHPAAQVLDAALLGGVLFTVVHGSLPAETGCQSGCVCNT